MAIFFDEQSKIFYLEGTGLSYAFAINKFGFLGICISALALAERISATRAALAADTPTPLFPALSMICMTPMIN
ncbi:MAG: hypothetical protein E7609_00115 [Ruminococcaceae bacterium]|nr:hypothetical protein [Oscillospiraceae bacterium]